MKKETNKGIKKQKLLEKEAVLAITKFYYKV